MMQQQDKHIQLMSDVLASQVAAGEVVERPASVIKELVENSIDAGSKTIRVEIERGGTALIKVSDDGCGMSRQDAGMCLLRHATSKLSSIEELFDIRHLGFRGEAIPSIASVSKMSITTRRAQDMVGTRLQIEGGIAQQAQDIGCAPGTVIEARELFFNTPVRRKFLKSEETETGHIEHQLKLHALAFPHIRFIFIKNGQNCFDTAATADLRLRIADFVGRETAAQLMPIRETEANGVSVSGYLLPLTAARRNRRMQYIFLNGRAIEDIIIARAIRDGYGGFPTGLHPGLFLYLEIDPGLVDVNVHPAKREVRFRRPSDVTTTVMDAISLTLAAHARAEEKTVEAPTLSPILSKPSPAPQGSFTLKPILQPIAQEQQKKLALQVAPKQEIRLAPAPAAPVAPAPTSPAPTHPQFTHIGTLHGQYALFENREGLVLLAPKAARERLIFERLMASNKRPLQSQRLLIPVLLDMDARDMGLALELKPQLEQAGFHVAIFGQRTLRIEAVPAILELHEAEHFLHELIMLFTRGEIKFTRSRNPYEIFATQLARQYAAQEKLEFLLQNAMQLLTELLQCEIPYCTPNGKPTLVPISLSEIKRKFHAQ